MSAPVATDTILDLAADPDRIAHLACGIELHRPDEPTHALCGHPLIGLDAPSDAPHCPSCDQRLRTDRGPLGPLGAFLGLLRCDAHPMGAATGMSQP